MERLEKKEKRDKTTDQGIQDRKVKRRHESDTRETEAGEKGDRETERRKTERKTGKETNHKDKTKTRLDEQGKDYRLCVFKFHLIPPRLVLSCDRLVLSCGGLAYYFAVSLSFAQHVCASSVAPVWTLVTSFGAGHSFFLETTQAFLAQR